MKAVIDRLKEPSSWTALGAAALCSAALFPMPAGIQTIFIIGGVVGLVFGVGLPERLRR